MNPSPGMTLVGAVAITDTPLEMEPHAPGFPAPTGLPSVPAAGYRVAPDAPINLGLGLRIEDPTAFQGFEGVFIDYTLGGMKYRAILQYRSVLCPGPPVEGEVCHAPHPDETWAPPWAGSTPVATHTAPQLVPPTPST